MMNKILEYEKKLMEYRAELNSLIIANNSAGSDYQLMEAKIDYLKKELAYIDNQLAILKAGLTVQSQAQTAERIATRTSENTSGKTTDSTAEGIAARPVGRTATTGTYYGGSTNYSIRNNATNPTRPKKSKDIENLMGKSIMGIFASVLIFISLVFFATLILPNLSNTIKMIAMYLVSFGFLVIGMFLLNKDKKNKLYLSISGCGIGAVFISLLVSNMYFKVIGDIALYLLIFVWALFVCYLSHSKSWIFQIIGQIGIFISILFGSILCSSTSDWTKLLFLVTFFIASETIFFVANYDKDYIKNSINLGFQLICLFILSLALPEYDNFSGLDVIVSYVLLILFSLIYIGISYLRLQVYAAGKIAFTIINILYSLMLASLIPFSGKPVYLIAFSLLSLIAIEWKFNSDKSTSINFIQCFHMLALIIYMYQLYYVDIIGFVMTYISFGLLIIPFALYGYSTKEKIYQTFSMIYLLLFVVGFSMDNTAYFIVGLGLFALLCYLLKEKNQYCTKVKTYIYFMFMIFITRYVSLLFDTIDIDSTIREFIIFALVCIVHIAAVKTPFARNWDDGTYENFFTKATNIVNAILMLFALSGIDAMAEYPILHFITILLALMLFSVNSKNLLQKEHIGWGIYVGIKFTIYMIAILDSFATPDFGISIGCLLFAIGSIVCGFMLCHKSLRVYGLVLSLLSVAKLVMLDINYENTLGHAFSFFICGILCFVISTIYNMLDKKITK